jgi:chloramphenicol-sensitive protein RarD
VRYPPGSMATDPRSRSGVLFAGGAFLIWGVVPLYFSALRTVSAYEIIAHRVLWSMLFLSLLLGVTGGFGEVRAVFRRPRLVGQLALTSTLVAGNWLAFVWAVNAGRVLETSLGYFITPQVNVLLASLFLGEKLRRTQWMAVALAAAGVVNQVLMLGRLPWVSLLLAGSFGCYGLLRKQIEVGPVSGLLVETLVATPVAVAYLGYLTVTGALAFRHGSPARDVLLVLLGVVTAVPLMLFAAGAQRLRLVTVGFLQYAAPSMTFLLAIFVFREPLGLARAVTFLLIWAGIAVYAVDSWRHLEKTPAPQVH